MHEIFTYSYPKNGPNAGKYALRGASELTIFWGEYVCGCVQNLVFVGWKCEMKRLDLFGQPMEQLDQSETMGFEVSSKLSAFEIDHNGGI